MYTDIIYISHSIYSAAFCYIYIYLFIYTVYNLYLHTCSHVCIFFVYTQYIYLYYSTLIKMYIVYYATAYCFLECCPYTIVKEASQGF